MARVGSSADRPPHPSVTADAVLLEVDLHRWAGERLARAGRQDALLGRVELLRLAADGRSIEARVRGNRPLPYRVEAWVDGRSIGSRCTCAGTSSVACKHAVAALEVLRFPAPRQAGRGKPRPKIAAGPGRPGRGRGRVVQHAPGGSGFLVVGGPERSLHRDERMALAREDELGQRRQRARRERAAVELLPAAGGPPRFRVEDKRGEQPQRVALRGPKGGLASCSCSDFAENELETCKHVERARGWYSRKKKQPPAPTMSLWWRPREWTRRVPAPLREIHVNLPQDDVPPSLREFFEPGGWLRNGPSAERASKWAERAVEQAGRVARRHGWGFDVDPLVKDRIRAAADEEEMLDRLASIEASGPLWDSATERLSFRLHEYQKEGAVFLARRGRAFLADDMGLGKTVQAVVAARLLRGAVGARKTLVVCPASLKHQWRREIELACGEQALVVEGSRRRRLELYDGWSDGFAVLNYELVLRDLEAIRQTRADLVVLDEAQRIKNWGTKTARAVKKLDSPYAFILTGTPLENRLLELHSLVEFLHPRALGPRWRLLPFHAVMERQGRIVAYEGLDVLRKRLLGFFLRRDRPTVLDQLPERTENTFWTGMTPAQRRPYRRHAAAVAALLSNGRPLRPAQVRAMLQALTRMRILCNAHAQYAWDDTETRLRDPRLPTQIEIKALHSPKLEEFCRVLEDLLEEPETKIVVFSQWERMLRLAHFAARPLLEARDLRAEVFHGGLSSRARGEVLAGFRLDPGFRVLFSTDAGGLGLNLQESASIVVNLEVPWNPAVLEQRIGRVHRMGQRRSVQVLHFVTRGAIEDRVRQVVESKRALFDGLLTDDVDRVVFDESSRTSFVRRLTDLID